jgi:hypothetical protein
VITILKNPRKRPKFLAYDLEWIPHKMTLRMCGVYDGDKYRWYETMDQFISSELTHKRRGWWFYAHAGGLADFQFVIERLTALGYYVHGSTSGSSVIIAHVSRAVWDHKKQKMVAGKDRWHFVDSYWLLKDSLRNIGKWLGIAKGNEDESVEWYETAPWQELRDYNEQDCRILYGGIKMFEDTVYELGGQLRMTQASCAMDLFRRKFLTEDIETSMQVNEVARNAYFASRVEVYATECEDAYYYDVNSSFPYAMTMPMPGALRGNYRKLPEWWSGPYLADVEVEVPDTYLPPLPRRMGGRLFFPVGKWRGWYSNIDIEVLLASGGRVNKCHESLTFDENEDLRAYASELYERRRKSEGFPRIAYKYLLNSLYGKFGESDQKSEVIVNPPEVLPEWVMTSPGIFIYEKVVEVPHMHVPIAVHVTAIARKTLYDYMGWSQELHYCDTDGFSTTSKYNDGDALGALKLEKYIQKGRFVQAKVYDLVGTDAAGKPIHTIKAKGFSLGKDPAMSLAKFEKLLNHEEIEYTRMARIKENARRGDFTPREAIFTKGIHEDSIGKRFFYPDGQSRPWHVDELEGAL